MSNTYRVYRLDRANHVVDVEWLEAADDAAAMAVAEAMTNCDLREVWRGDRLIGTIRVAAAEDPSAAFWL